MNAITSVTDEVRQRMIDELTGPGMPFEVVEEVIRKVRYRVFNSAPRNLHQMYASGFDRDSFYARAMRNWFDIEDFPYIVYQDERYSFMQTYQMAATLAWKMKRRYGIEKGDRVVIAMRNYPEFCLAFMAATAIGALAVPLNAWWKESELVYGLTDSEPKLIFADTERAARMDSYLTEKKTPLVVVRTKEVLSADLTPFQELITGSLETDFPPTDVDPDDDAYIMYTSGSTGRPRGVVSSHRAIISTAMTWQFPIIGLVYLNRNCLDKAKPAFRPSSLLCLPLFHVTGLMSSFLSSIALKRSMVIMHKWDAETALQLINKERITHFTGVPTMSWELVNSPNLHRYDVSSLSVLNAGGAARPPQHVEVLEDVLGRHISQTGYGLTETTAIGAINAGDNYARRPDSVGRPSAPLVEAKVVDLNGNTLAPGKIGEICLKSPANMKCYWNDPEATADIFLDDGWIKSGDVGLIDEDGFIYIKDRLKDMIIRGGENIACQEVEDAIHEHPRVNEAAVFGLPEQRLGEQVAAVVMVRPGKQLTVEELKLFLYSRLAQFKVPALIWIQEEPLPRGDTDKIYKKKLREQKLKLVGAG